MNTFSHKSSDYKAWNHKPCRLSWRLGSWHSRDLWLAMLISRLRLHAIKSAILSRCVYLCVVPSVLWRCWLGGRKGIRPVKTEWLGAGVVSVWSEVQTCIWPSWCHCHSLSLASVKARLLFLSCVTLSLVLFFSVKCSWSFCLTLWHYTNIRL